MAENGARLELGGRTLLEVLRAVSEERLGVDSELGVCIRDALNGVGMTKITNVQEALARLPSQTQEELLCEAHRRMCLNGFGLLSNWPQPTPDGNDGSTRH